jgi:hypothetical protein
VKIENDLPARVKALATFRTIPNSKWLVVLFIVHADVKHHCANLHALLEDIRALP